MPGQRCGSSSFATPTLIIYSDSEYAIRSLTEWALQHAAGNWACHNGDLLRDCMAWIRARPATLRFEHVDAHSGNAHNDGADTQAKGGAVLDAVPPYAEARLLPSPDLHPMQYGPALALPKVTSSIPRHRPDNLGEHRARSARGDGLPSTRCSKHRRV